LASQVPNRKVSVHGIRRLHRKFLPDIESDLAWLEAKQEKLRADTLDNLTRLRKLDPNTEPHSVYFYYGYLERSIRDLRHRRDIGRELLLRDKEYRRIRLQGFPEDGSLEDLYKRRVDPYYLGKACDRKREWGALADPLPLPFDWSADVYLY
jgi:hypothetical protein